MFLQIPHDPERLPTRGTAVRLLSGVKPQVCFQVVSQSEAFAALRASVGPLPSVEPQVPTEALSQCKRLGASRTRIWFFSGVEALVPPENLSAFECFSADAASVSIAGVADDLLETPNTVSARGEAADAMACVKPLVVTQVFGQRPASFVVNNIILRHFV